MALILVANTITRRLQSTMGESISPLFFAAVALAAGFGGVWAGLLACGLAGYMTAVFYPNPPGTGPFWWDDLVRVCVFLMVAVLISSLAHLRRAALAELKVANDGLERRVRARTAELERSNRQLTESEERFRALVDGASDHAICMLDATGQVIGWNAGAERTLGYAAADVAGQSFARFYPPDARARGEPGEHLGHAATLGRDEDEGWRVRRDGSRFWASAILTPLRDDAGGGGPRGFAYVLRDITELKRLEKEVLEASETEQRRIGQDLHDGLGQELTGLSFLTQNLRRRLADAGRAEANDADRIAGLIARNDRPDPRDGAGPVAGRVGIGRAGGGAAEPGDDRARDVRRPLHGRVRLGRPGRGPRRLGPPLPHRPGGAHQRRPPRQRQRHPTAAGAGRVRRGPDHRGQRVGPIPHGHGGQGARASADAISGPFRRCRFGLAPPPRRWNGCTMHLRRRRVRRPHAHWSPHRKQPP